LHRLIAIFVDLGAEISEFPDEIKEAISYAERVKANDPEYENAARLVRNLKTLMPTSLSPSTVTLAQLN
jgi:hypothetical protein